MNRKPCIGLLAVVLLGGGNGSLWGMDRMYADTVGSAISKDSVTNATEKDLPMPATGLCPFRVDLTWEQCREMAIENDVYLKNAELDVLSAREQKGEALAAYFPNVSASAFAFMAFDPLLKLGITDILGHSDFTESLQYLINQYAPHLGIDPMYSTLKKGVVASVSAIQPVYAGGRIVYGNRLAALGMKASGLQQRLQWRKTVEEAEKNYWLVVSLEEKQKTLFQIQILLDTLYKDVHSAFSAGLATEHDLMQVKLKSNELKSGVIELQNGIRLAKMNLFNGIGLAYNPYRTLRIDSVPYIDDVHFIDTIGGLAPPEVYYVPEETVAADQEEMYLLDLSVEAKRLEKKMTVGETLPQVGVGASYGYGNLLDKGDWNGAVYVTARIPLSDWGGNARKIRRYDYQLRKAENEKAYFSAQILLQIRQLWFGLTSSWEQLKVAEESLETARVGMEMLQAYYRAGLSPLSELLQAQTQFRQCAEKYVDRAIAYRTAVQAYRNRSENSRESGSPEISMPEAGETEMAD